MLLSEKRKDGFVTKIQINLLKDNMVLHFSLRMCRAIPSLMSSSYGAEIGPGTALPLTDLNSMKYVIPKVLTPGTIKIIAFWDMLACTS